MNKLESYVRYPVHYTDVWSLPLSLPERCQRNMHVPASLWVRLDQDLISEG